ncbi:MAG: hypothetical protein L3J44_09750 [Campylobacteraceae bacterium]|nr:hypothetical protein [Campylobacteraceae bacterium]
MNIQDVAEKFIEQSRGESLSQADFRDLDYRDLKIRVGFGQGIKAKVTWLAFLKGKNTVQKGIFPVLLFDHANDCLVVAYGVSETYAPETQWNIRKQKAIDFTCFKCKIDNIKSKYPSSFVENCFNVKNLSPKILDEITQSLDIVINEYQNATNKQKVQKYISLNQIFYGPPGTGKTFRVVEEALKIIGLKENLGVGLESASREELRKKFEEYKSNGQIEFITFHQSYSYEEFIEGLKPKSDDEGNIFFEIDDGVFKELALSAIKNFENARVQNGVDVEKLLNDFADKLQNGDIDLGVGGAKLIKASYDKDGNVKSFLVGGSVKSGHSLTRKVIKRVADIGTSKLLATCPSSLAFCRLRGVAFSVLLGSLAIIYQTILLLIYSFPQKSSLFLLKTSLMQKLLSQAIKVL